MVTEVPVEKVLDIAGHKNHRKGADFKLIASVMQKLGYPNASRKYRPFVYEKELPSICFLCLAWKKSGAHLVVYNNGKIYCPGKGIYDYNMKNIDQQGVKNHWFLRIGEKSE